MSSVHVEQPHSMSVEEAKSALESFAAEIAKYGMKLEWTGNNARLKGTGASGEVAVHDDKVTVTVKLGMIARAAGVKADKLEASISRRLANALSQTA